MGTAPDRTTPIFGPRRSAARKALLTNSPWPVGRLSSDPWTNSSPPTGGRRALAATAARLPVSGRGCRVPHPPRRHARPPAPGDPGFMVGLVGLAIGLGATAMALTTWFYFAIRLSRLAKDLEQTMDQGPRSGSRSRACPPSGAGPGVQPGGRHVRRRRGTGHPGPADRDPEPRVAASNPGRRGGTGQPPLQAAVGGVHGHRPLQVDQRQPRPPDRRRRPPAGGRADHPQHPGQRHLRPLRRRGVHAHPARDHARGRPDPGRGAARDGHAPPLSVASGSWWTPRSASAWPEAQLRAAGRPPGGRGRCGHVRREVRGPEPQLPVRQRHRRVDRALRGDHPERRDAAAAIGRWASASAAQALASVLALSRTTVAGRPT